MFSKTNMGDIFQPFWLQAIQELYETCEVTTLSSQALNFLSSNIKGLDLSETMLELQDLSDRFELKVWSFVDVEKQEFPFCFPKQCHSLRNSSSDQCDIDAHLLNHMCFILKCLLPLCTILPPQNEHHHEDRPDILDERQKFYYSEVLEMSQTSSEVPAILLCLVAATEDWLSLIDTVDIVVLE
ncbi:hypothetical protein Tco_1067850 [Tanacetum coccineum]|uniref:Uncharacterized protein n=1 Tax=Tanacetum coccineum TaxID=301880 RepID=A0ABQ5HE24_9ASTR